MRIFHSALVFLLLVMALTLVDLPEGTAKAKNAKSKNGSYAFNSGVKQLSAKPDSSKHDPSKQDSSKPETSKHDSDSADLIFIQTGGFIGVNKKYEQHLAELSDDDRRSLEKLIEQSGLSTAKNGEKITKGAADMFRYEFRLRKGSEEHCVVFDDGSLPDSYRPLVQYLKPKLVDQKNR